MLTAFNYYEPEEENRIQKGIKESPFFERELEIAKRFTKVHISHNIIKKHCVVCESNKLSKFYEKWGVTYIRCENCYSIMANVIEKDVTNYVQLKELLNLRLSEQYQQDGTKNRQQKWEELLDWLKYRTFRYCRRNIGFSVLDYGTRWKGLEKIFRESDLCERYELRDSILLDSEEDLVEQECSADIILALDYIQQKVEPKQFFQKVHYMLKKHGLFILGIKVGSGFDVLSLRENNRNVFPYEHVLMPSKEGIEILLNKTGFELLEFTTPGTFDLNFVKMNKEGLAFNDYFLKYFLETAKPSAEAEFQRFIQKSGLSSYAQVIARRIG